MRNFTLVAVLVSLASSPQVSQAQAVRYAPAVRVTRAPPAPRREVAPPAPSVRHQWIPGYWGWRGSSHLWFPGYWALPPAYGYAWELPRWEAFNGAWVFYDGHWRPTERQGPAQVYQPPAPPVEEVIVEAPPPVQVEELRPAPPFQGAVWIPGYWHWSGVRHVWAAGRWSPRPAGYAWEQHRWDRRPDGRWVQREGHWHARDDWRRDDEGGHRGHHPRDGEHGDGDGQKDPGHR